MGYIICFILGALGASAVWFFVWKNNKEKFEAALKIAAGKVDQVK